MPRPERLLPVLVPLLAPLLALGVCFLLSAAPARADTFLQVCSADGPCTIKHRYELRSVCELDRASAANVQPSSRIDCISVEDINKSR